MSKATSSAPSQRMLRVGEQVRAALTQVLQRGEVRDPAPVYAEDTRVWTVSKSDGSQTFYVKYGDWFAWLCSIVSLGLLAFAWRRPQEA